MNAKPYSEQPTYSILKSDVGTDYIGVSEFLKFYYWATKFSNCSVRLNISAVSNVDANLSALILALIYKLKKEQKVYVFVLLADHMSVFYRNGLISQIQGKGNGASDGDNRDSTIPVYQFPMDAAEDFCSYLRQDFFRHRALSLLSKNVKGILSTHFEEVFTNVILHAETTYPVFSCGQYFPEKSILKFTLVDLGIGFLKKIQDKTKGEKSTDNDAIIWSVNDLNTTKDIRTYGPGGTGLKELKKYCSENNASFHICSGSGYVNFIKDKTVENKLPNPLFGSMLNLIFRNI